MTLMAWLLGLLTVGGAFVADRGWEEVSLSWEESLLPINVFAGVITNTALLLGIVGWAMGRYLALALSGLLAACAIAQMIVGAQSAPVWTVGTGIAAVMAATDFVSSSRQLRAIRTLAARLRNGETVELGSDVLTAERNALRGGWWITLAFLCISLALCTWFVFDWVDAQNKAVPSDGSTFRPFEAVFAPPAMMLLIWSCSRNIRKGLAYRWAGRFVWIVPGAGGPVWTNGLEPSYGGRVEPEDNRANGCICREGEARRDPEYEDFPDDDVAADDYCALHGFDAVNSMDHASFRASANSAWLWDENSRTPNTSDELTVASKALLGCAGYLFCGLLVVRSSSGIEMPASGATEAYEINKGDADIPNRAKAIPPSEQGILDTIDLAPAGLSGTAVRYRHGRAWLRTDEP
ncbi:hypothetical protein [Arthrobacter celericrescens]|uniref:hypothetical protein n=1 Tax=Arthrobacter celericrescens TaxID=2320851 RepID=UPI0013C4A4C1|nr:hypothetical protein [Arthrobacter celericrescens]